VPDLVVIVGCAVIHLGRSSRVRVPVGDIETVVHVGPGDAVIGGDGEELVGVAREAGEDLHLDAIGGAAVGDIETLVAEDANVTASGARTAGYVPSLSSRAVAVLDGDSRVVGVAGSGQAFASLETGLDGNAVGRRRRSNLNVLGSPCLVRSASAVPNLDRVTVCLFTIGVIQTLARGRGIARQGDGSITSRSPLLVLPAGAGPDLHLLAVGGDAVRVVEAFVAEDLDGTAGNGPQLVDGFGMGTSDAGFDFDCCSVCVRGGDEAF